MRPGITLITPTGDRYLAFKFCCTWISKQTRQPDQWIVIDDGIERDCSDDCIQGQDYKKRIRTINEPLHTLHLNILEALPLIKYNKILIIEDDDYYAPNYIETMENWLCHNHIAGQIESIYYNVRDKNFRQMHNRRHVSFCQTGFTSYNISKLEQAAKLIDKAFREQNKNPEFLDILLWRSAAGKKYLDKSLPKLCIGIKGLPGRNGIGIGHSCTPCNDPDYEILRSLIGKDAEAYVEATRLPDFNKNQIPETVEIGQNKLDNTVIHSLLRARHIRRLIDGSFALLRPNNETRKLLHRCCREIEPGRWELVLTKCGESVSPFIETQKNKYKDKICYIIGKGPGLDTIPFNSDTFENECPIIAINESIKTVEKKYRINDEIIKDLYCIQQDAPLKEICWSHKGTMLLPFFLRWYYEHPRRLTYVYTDFEVKDKRHPLGVESAILIAKCWGCKHIVFMGCDAAATHKSCDYAKSIGHAPKGNKERFIRHIQYIKRTLAGHSHEYKYPEAV